MAKLPSACQSATTDAVESNMTEQVAVSGKGWQDFLNAYARGAYPANETPSPPMSLQSPTVERTCPNFDQYKEAPVYDCHEIDENTADKVKEFYAEYGFLPPPRVPSESLREKCIVDYDLYSPEQQTKIKSVIELVQIFFGGFVTFTLFRNGKQEFAAISADEEALRSHGLQAGMSVLQETSLCGHSVLWTKEKLYVRDLSEDWRYRGNPFVSGQPHFRGYVGSVVTLQVDPLRSTSEERIPIGVINVLQTGTPLEALDDKQEKVLKTLTEMLESQLRATWDGNGRIKSAKARGAISQLLDQALFTNPSAMHGQDRRVSDAPTIQAPGAEAIGDLHAGYAKARTEQANELASLGKFATNAFLDVITQARSALIIDLQSISASKLRGLTNYLIGSGESLPSIIAYSDKEGHDPPSITDQDALANILAHLAKNTDNSQKIYQHGQLSGLEPFLPTTTTCHTVIRLDVATQPLFCIVITSDKTNASFAWEDALFMKSLGAILRAQILQKRVYKSDAAKTAFLSSISHELRTPLHGISSSIELANKALENGETADVKEFFGIISSSARALDRILDSVLEFTQTTQVARTTLPAQVNLDELVQETVSIILAGRPMDPNVVLTTDLDTCIRLIRTDGTRLQRILLNGIGNAIKHTPTGSITVSLRSLINPSRLILEIRDTGTGIPEAFIERAFQPFAQADSFSAGMGLGLYLIKVMVDDLCGTVELTSELGKGTTLSVTIPVEFLEEPPAVTGLIPLDQSEQAKVIRDATKEPQEKEHQEEKLPKKDDTATDAGLAPKTPVEFSNGISKLPQGSSPTRVLVIEDDEVSRKILVAVLKRQKVLPVAVQTAVNGLDGLQKFETFYPQVVLTDISMPEMDGITAAHEMRKIEVMDEKRIPSKIFAITGLGSTNDRMKQHALTGGAALNGWLIKGQHKLSHIVDLVNSAVNESTLSIGSENRT